MINTLKTEILTRGGLARSNKFKLFIPAASYSGLSGETSSLDTLCESVTLPGRQITSAEYSLNRHKIKYPTGFILEDVELTFLLTNDYYPHKFFQEWMEKIIPLKDYYLNYKSEYIRDVTISQLSGKNEVVCTYKLLDAYPLTIQNISLNNTTEDDISKFSVTLTYDKYEIT
jgi:hypothetical protein